MTEYHCAPDIVVVILATKAGLQKDNDVSMLPSLIPLRGQPLIIHQIVNAIKSGFHGVFLTKLPFIVELLVNHLFLLRFNRFYHRI